MTSNELELLRDLQPEVPDPDEEAIERIYAYVTRAPERRRRPRWPFSWRPSLPRSRRVLVAVGVALVLGGGSAIAAVTVANDGSPVQFSRTTGQTPSLGTDAASIVAALKARLPNVLSIRLTNDAITNGSGNGTTNYLVAHIEIAAPADTGPEIARAMWESNLVGGALLTAFTQAGLEPPYSADLTVVLPDGKRDNVGGGIGKVVPNQVFDPITAQVQARIKQNAAAEGFTDVRVTVFPVLNEVAEIHATATTSPAAAAAKFTSSGGLDGLLGQSENDFEGIYFQLDDAQGQPIYIQSTAPRAGAGGYWAAPSTGIQGDQLRIPHRNEGQSHSGR